MMQNKENMEIDTRGKSILIGLYISKYNRTALKELGFSSYQQAFNILGYSLGSKPASIKNYRDEFDPLFPNNRKGWNKRNIRDYCKHYYDKYNNLDFDSFSELIKSFLINDYDTQKFIETINNKDYSESIAKRLFTGKAAEEYFKSEYSKIDLFKPYDLVDTTQMACGFDFKLSSNLDFYCVEVKGLNGITGGIQFTEKEFIIAKELQSKFCLFIVKNFKEKPLHEIVFDPVNSRLNFTETKRQIIQTNYNAII